MFFKERIVVFEKTWYNPKILMPKEDRYPVGQMCPKPGAGVPWECRLFGVMVALAAVLCNAGAVKREKEVYIPVKKKTSKLWLALVGWGLAAAVNTPGRSIIPRSPR